MENKTVIFGAASKSVGRQLLEWVVSLRSLGRYQDAIVVLDYGVETVIKKYCQSLGVKFISCILRTEEVIGNSRYIDLIPILSKYPDYYVAIFDIDIWFQDNVRDIWEKIKTTEGCLMACETTPLNMLKEIDYKGPEGGDFRNKMLEKYIRLIDAFDGIVNSGLLAGKTKPLINKLMGFRQALSKMLIISTRGAEQFYLNYSFDFSKDEGNGVRWNCLINHSHRRKNYYFYKDSDGNDLTLSGIHLAEYKLEDRSNHMFSNHHRKIFSAVLGEVKKEYNIIKRKEEIEKVSSGLEFGV